MKNKNYIRPLPYLRNSTAFDEFFDTLQHDDIYRRFFHFLKILIFRIASGVKGQKNACLSACYAPYLRNYTSYEIIISDTQMKDNDIISWRFFSSFFENFNFSEY